ncbi:MAG: PKD domain-containing protein [Bacteroidia bacterium]|nr:PKD domain-containing protein [Bacteroidia bacterium]
MKQHVYYLLFSLAFLIPAGTQATHIVGAELYYSCINPATNTYDLTLKLYRDCQNGQAPYDAVIYLFIFDALTGATLQTVPINIPPTTPQIQPNDWGPCVGTTPAICVQEGIYTTTVTLPPNANGYNLGWSRCCRNAAISNLANPLNEGITFLARIPPSSAAVCNNMPVFDQVPPVFLCANQPFFFDHSATDVDGDSLVYALTNPYTGTNISGLGTGNPMMGGNQPTVDPLGNPMGPPPYNTVQFGVGYTFLDPFGSNNFVIDPQTGFITVTPTQAGIYVFSISVFEYRNGVLLSENRRDFQIHVLNCLPQGNPPAIQHDLTGLNFSNDTVFVTAGVPFCYDITITDDPGDVLQGYTVSAAFGNGNFIPPAATFTYSGTNPIIGQVCWEPACAYNNQVIPLIVGGRDQNGCQNINDALDTVYIKVSVPPNQVPVISTNLSGLQTNGDTILIQANTNFCFTAQITDPNPGDAITAYPVSPIFSTAGGPTLTQSGTNPVQMQVCWTPGCAYAGQTVLLEFGGQDQSLCNLSGSVTKKIWVRIIAPPNNPPLVSSTFNGTPVSGDTIQVIAQNNLCFTFTANDADAGSALSFQGISPIFTATGGATVTTTGTNPLSGTICWVPGCQFVGQVVPFIFRVTDPGACNNSASDFDTVYVAISAPPNTPPQISSNLLGNTVVNDTIIVPANQNFCYTFTASDANNTAVTVTPLSPLFSTPGGPVYTASGTNPVSGQICWNPSCFYAGQLIPLVLEVTDNANCNNVASARDTVWIRINVPANAPPTITPNLSGNVFSNDTIFTDALAALCFDLVFADANAGDSLEVTPLSPIFSGPNAATFVFSGINPVVATVCWTPSCDYEGQVVPFVVKVRDNGQCDNEKEAQDTIYVKISDPLTLPPIVGHDLTGTNFVGDTIYMEIGDEACYTFYVADQTTDNGISYTYELQNIFTGQNLGTGVVTSFVRNDSILGTICFPTDCSNGGTYFRSILTGTDKETCPPFQQTRDTVIIKVNTSFLSFAGNDTGFCAGSGGVQLLATPIGGTAPYYYLWNCDNPGNCGFSLGNNNIADPVANPTTTTTYSVQITDFNGCTSEIDDIVIEVLALPIADAGPDTFVCEDGIGTRLQGSVANSQEAPGPYTWLWTPPAGLSNATAPDPYANPDTTTIYTLFVTSANGCTSVNTTLDTLSTIVVSVRERPVVEAGRDTSICLGETVQLLGYASEAGPQYTYAWTPATGLSDSSIQAPLASPPLTVTYFLVAWSNGCPSVADSVTLTVNTIPTLQTLPQYEVCALDSVQLQVLAGGDPEATAYSYQWSPVAGLSDPNIRNPIASPAQTTVYSLIASSNFGCASDTETVTVVVLPAPVADAGSDTVVCRGDTIQLQGTHTFAGGAGTMPVFYTWTPADALSSQFVATPLAAPLQTTLYTLTTSSGSCTTEDKILITVAEPVTAFATSDTNRICQGDSVQLTGLGGMGAATYLWTPAAGLSDPASPAPMAAPDTTTTYVLTVTESVCSDRAAVTILVNPAPRPTFLSSQTSGCEDLTVSFLQDAPNAVAYIWDFGDGSPITNAANPTHTFTEPGTYAVSLVVTGAGGCEAVSLPVVIQVFAPGVAAFSATPDAETPVVLPDAAVTFNDLSTGAVSWFWDFGDGKTAAEQHPVHTYTQPGNYTVTLTITDANGCVDQYQYGILTVVETNVLIPNVFTPNDDGVNDTFTIQYNGGEDFQVKILDRWGRPVFSSQSPANAWDGLTPGGSPAADGVYYYAVTIGERTFTGDLTLLR